MTARCSSQDLPGRLTPICNASSGFPYPCIYMHIPTHRHTIQIYRQPQQANVLKAATTDQSLTGHQARANLIDFPRKAAPPAAPAQPGSSSRSDTRSFSDSKPRETAHWAKGCCTNMRDRAWITRTQAKTQSGAQTGRSLKLIGWPA